MSRAYDNTRRDEQAQQTRARILDAVIATLGRQEQFAVADVARAAGVSVPTVYRHFPTHEALMDAVQESIGARLGRPQWPESPDDLVTRVPSRYAWFEQNGPMIRAILLSPVGREIKRAVRRRREQGMTRALAPHTAHLDPPRARALVAIIAAMDDAYTWRELRDEWGISHDDAAWAAKWAMRTLLDGLAGDRSRKRRKG